MHSISYVGLDVHKNHRPSGSAADSWIITTHLIGSRRTKPNASLSRRRSVGDQRRKIAGRRGIGGG